VISGSLPKVLPFQRHQEPALRCVSPDKVWEFRGGHHFFEAEATVRGTSCQASRTNKTLNVSVKDRQKAIT
jgi:hypothetical protein